jgi:membrane associated rhomboid family serine protease
MWMVYLMEYLNGYNWNSLGIYPRSFEGLVGVFSGPFIHSSANHLIHNSLPFFLLLSALIFFYREPWRWIFILGLLSSGFMTWCFGREAYHIGASGVIYFLFGFLLCSGFIRRNKRLLTLALGVCFLYGGMFWYIFPVDPSISWEGHSSGLIAGLILALLFRKRGPQKSDFQFERTEFDELFEEDGSLKESLPQDFVEESTTSDRDIE